MPMPVVYMRDLSHILLGIHTPIYSNYLVFSFFFRSFFLPSLCSVFEIFF
jgi:hypothetical protein